MSDIKELKEKLDEIHIMAEKTQTALLGDKLMRMPGLIDSFNSLSDKVSSVMSSVSTLKGDVDTLKKEFEDFQSEIKEKEKASRKKIVLFSVGSAAAGGGGTWLAIAWKTILAWAAKLMN